MKHRSCERSRLELVPSEEIIDAALTRRCQLQPRNLFMETKTATLTYPSWAFQSWSNVMSAALSIECGNLSPSDRLHSARCRPCNRTEQRTGIDFVCTLVQKNEKRVRR